MRRVVADKIASVALQAKLGAELRLSQDIVCEEGVLVAVEVLDDKASYNELELTSGRTAVVKRGDILVGALGHRNALFGYSGRLPTKLRPGDEVHLLSLGGVLGLCESADLVRGTPFSCRVLGAVLTFPYLGERIGVPARAGGRSMPFREVCDTRGVPVVAVVGTCMNSGKTAAACAIVSGLRRKGWVVDALKATGVSARRDVLAMEDAGARHTLLFTDLGVVTTTSRNAPALARTMLTELASFDPDVIVLELGDGLLGAYGVESVLNDPQIRRSLTAVVLSANDPVAAWGGVTILRDRFDIDPCAVTGPATDNAVGVDIVKAQLGLPAANALVSGGALADLVWESCRKPRLLPRRPGALTEAATHGTDALQVKRS